MKAQSLSSPVVVVTRRIPGEAVGLLRQSAQVWQWEGDEPIPRSRLLQEVDQAVGLLCLLTERVDDELLDRAPGLKVVANMAVGYDNVDLAACARQGVTVTNTPGVLTDTTADLAFALLLAAARRVAEGDRFVREGRWTTWDPMLLLGRDVHHATLGIVGLGRIGRQVAKRARGFDMRVLYYSQAREEDAERELGVRYADLETLLRESDFVSLHVDLNPTTRGLLGEAELRLMKPTAYLVNTARGPVVDTDALYEALRGGRLAGAALDVTDPEPLPADHPLLSLPNVVVVPHIGSASVATRTRMALLAAENVVAVLGGRPALTPVASDEWPVTSGQ